MWLWFTHFLFLCNIVFNENDTLANFIGELHENRIKEFKDLDVKIINLNRKRKNDTTYTSIV